MCSLFFLIRARIFLSRFGAALNFNDEQHNEQNKVYKNHQGNHKGTRDIAPPGREP